MAEEKIHNNNNNNEVMRGCIKRSKGPWVVKRSTKSRGLVTKLRFPSEKERLNNKQRERKRRLITHNIFAGLRTHGNYNLPKNPDSNDLLKALCQEAGWHVDDDGTIYKNNHHQLNLKGSALAATTTTTTVVQNLNLMGTKSGRFNYNMEDQDQDYCTCNCNVEEENNVVRSSQFVSESTTQAAAAVAVAGHDDDIELTLSFQLS